MSIGALAPDSRGWLLGEVPGPAGQSRACFGFPLNCFAGNGLPVASHASEENQARKRGERERTERERESNKERGEVEREREKDRERDRKRGEIENDR